MIETTCTIATLLGIGWFCLEGQFINWSRGRS